MVAMKEIKYWQIGGGLTVLGLILISMSFLKEPAWKTEFEDVQKKHNQQPQQSSTISNNFENSEANPTTLPVINTSTWKTYTNVKFGFEMQYPPYLKNPTIQKRNDYEAVGTVIHFTNTTNTLDMPSLSIYITSRSDGQRQDQLIKAQIPICEKECAADESACYPVGCPSKDDSNVLNVWDEKFLDYTNAKLNTLCRLINEGGFSFGNERDCHIITVNDLLMKKSVQVYAVEGESSSRHYEFFHHDMRYSINFGNFDYSQNWKSFEEYVTNDPQMRDLTVAVQSIKFINTP